MAFADSESSQKGKYRMKNNLVLVRTANGGIAPSVAVDKSVYKVVEKFLARDLYEFRQNPSRCVIAEFDYAQSVPLVRQSVAMGYRTLLETVIAVVTGCHFTRPVYHSLFWANSEGLRLIARHGSPRKAFSSL